MLLSILLSLPVPATIFSPRSICQRVIKKILCIEIILCNTLINEQFYSHSDETVLVCDGIDIVGKDLLIYVFNGNICKGFEIINGVPLNENIFTHDIFLDYMSLVDDI